MNFNHNLNSLVIIGIDNSFSNKYTIDNNIQKYINNILNSFNINTNINIYETINNKLLFNGTADEYSTNKVSISSKYEKSSCKSNHFFSNNKAVSEHFSRTLHKIHASME